jgi:hypothetical protein
MKSFALEWRISDTASLPIYTEAPWHKNFTLFSKRLKPQNILNQKIS